MSQSETIHAGCVLVRDSEQYRGVLICGRSGAGKSDLALRLIDRGARLVSDDYTIVTRVGQRLLASPPATIAGRIEVRGIGIVAIEHVGQAEVGLVIDLDAQPQRMPDGPARRSLAGIELPAVALAAFEASAAIKAELAVRRWWRSAA